MKNIYKAITERSERMTERAQMVAEVRDEINSSMREINLMLDETNLYVRQIERDNAEITKLVATLKDRSAQTIELHVHGLEEVTL